MIAEPEFPLLSGLDDDHTNANGNASVPDGQGGYVFVDGTLHRIRDLDTPIVGEGAIGLSVNEKELEKLCTFVDVTYLGFKGLRTTTIAPVTRMKRLRRLRLWWVQKLADLSPLANMPLDVLVLDDIRNANDIAPLAQMQTLKALMISGGMNSTQLIETLEPLAALPQLSELRLTALKVGDESLHPIARCRALVDLTIANSFETAEYAYLRAKRPDIRCPMLAGYEKGYSIGGKDIMVTGKRKPFLSSKKDAKRLQTYQDRFEALVAEFKE
jgi:hypothetical protein